MENYEALDVIGQGSFGVVRRIRRKQDGKILVWKELNYGNMNEKEKQLLVSEVNILRELRHPHVVRYYDRIIDREKTIIYIVMEHCEGGDVQTLIKRARRERKPISEDTIWKIFSQILLALNECHNTASHNNGEREIRSSRIIHRDIKPSNVFLDGSNNVKIGDFGLARILGNGSLARTNVGTPFYMSPEQVKELPYNEKTDIWSLGCLLYECAALAPPFEAANQVALAAKIKIGRFNRLPSQYSEALNRTVKMMLQLDQSRRPSVDELLALPQLQGQLHERKISQQYTAIKRKDDDVKKREDDLARKERELSDREKRLNNREKELERRERMVEEKERMQRRPSMERRPSLESREALKNLDNNLTTETERRMKILRARVESERAFKENY